MSDRQELIKNAVVFLSDPKTQSSPLAQRIQFLEAKGLTGPEIEVAFKQVSNQTTALAHNPGYPPSYSPALYPIVGPPQQWDWRDYFITAVLSGTAAYTAVTLFKKYLLPHLQPPNSTAYEEDRDALTAQFDAAEALLKEIQAETAAIRTAVDDQKKQVEKATKDVQTVVKEMRDGESKTRDDMRDIREEVKNVREMLPKMIEKNKESQNQSLAELQQELKSLKALLLSRGSGPAVSPMPVLPTRPSIPAWQLAPSTDTILGAGPSPVPSILSNGKAKEVDVPSGSSS
jgi:peroxin-14